MAKVSSRIIGAASCTPSCVPPASRCESCRKQAGSWADRGPEQQRACRSTLGDNSCQDTGDENATECTGCRKTWPWAFCFRFSSFNPLHTSNRFESWGSTKEEKILCELFLKKKNTQVTSKQLLGHGYKVQAVPHLDSLAFI